MKGLIQYFLSQVIRAAGTPYVIYYLIAIFFGSFFLYNLLLAVVQLAFRKERKDELREVSRSGF